MYGMTKDMRLYVKDKIKRQKDFLNRYYIEIGDEKIYLSKLVKNSFINTHKYIAEINHRVYSLYEYAQERNLTNIFFTLTLPTEWHKKRVIRLRNGQKRLVRNDNFQKIIDGVENTPKNAAKELTKMFHKILKDRAMMSIPKKNRVYFRVIEPHRDGTPHLHISFFIPKEYKERFVNMLKRKFPYPLGKVVEDVDNPVAYLMKYILKTFDDLRTNPDNLSDLTYWYIYWGIPRIYTSRTLISLEVYRLLGGRYTLKYLTQLYEEKKIDIWVNLKTGKIDEIVDDNPFGAPIYRRRRVTIHKEEYYEPMPEKIYSKHELKQRNRAVPIEIEGSDKKLYYVGHRVVEPIVQDVVIPARMKDYELYSYYHSFDPDDLNTNYLHFAITHNEAVKRGLIDFDEIAMDEAERIEYGLSSYFE